MNKRLAVLTVALIILVAGVMASAIQAFSGAVEYKELTTTGATSTNGTTFQGDVLVCCWNTTGGSFSGTVKTQIYQTLGTSDAGSKGEWIDTGDTFTAEGCKVLTVPENGVKMRGYATVSSGSIRVRISQEYPGTIRTQGGK